MFGWISVAVAAAKEGVKEGVKEDFGPEPHAVSLPFSIHLHVNEIRLTRSNNYRELGR